MIDMNEVLDDPSKFFQNPNAVVQHPDLSDEQKIEILQHWKFDAIQMQIAEEENMRADPSALLDEILEALNDLGVTADEESGGPTKHGGE